MKKQVKLKRRERPSWDESFIFRALWSPTRSSCLHLFNGVAVVQDKRIIASGYNGAPPNTKNCLELGCRKEEYGIDFHCKGMGVCRGTHAEENGMRQIALKDLKGAILYTVYYPCSNCAKDIVGSGIKRVVYLKHYDEDHSYTDEAFKEAGVRVKKLKLNLEKCLTRVSESYIHKR